MYACVSRLVCNIIVKTRKSFVHECLTLLEKTFRRKDIRIALYAIETDCQTDWMKATRSVVKQETYVTKGSNAVVISA